MRKMTLTLFGYAAIAAIFVFFLAGCVEYDTYRGTNRGADAARAKPSKTNQTDIKKQDTDLGQQNNNKESDVQQQISNGGGIPKDLAIGADVKSDQQKPFLDRYEDQLKKLMENEKEINQYKEKQKEQERTINELKTILETLTANLEGERVKVEGLQEENSKLIEQFTKENNDLKEKADRYDNEIKELKVKLAEAQISEVKAKQELIRVKTQYIMDKKRWGVEE